MISFTPYSSELCSLWAFFDFFCQTRRVKISTKIYSIMILGMITLDQYLMGREVRFPITDEYKDNALILLDKISELEHIFGETLTMTSGYRPSQINRQTPGASLTSTHETCEGIDLRDISGELGQF